MQELLDEERASLACGVALLDTQRDSCRRKMFTPVQFIATPSTKSQLGREAVGELDPRPIVGREGSAHQNRRLAALANDRGGNRMMNQLWRILIKPDHLVTLKELRIHLW